MVGLVRDKARTSSRGRTRRKSTRRGANTPWRAPSALIQLRRLLWMCAAIIRTVSRGMPGTLLDQTAPGRCSIRNVVARLFVRHAATTVWAASGSLGTVALLVTFDVRRHSVAVLPNWDSTATNKSLIWPRG